MPKPRSIITPKVGLFIKANRLEMPSREIAAHVGLSKTVILRYLKANGLSISKDEVNKFKARSRKTTFTSAEDAKIRAEYLTKPIKTLAKEMNRSHCGLQGRIKHMGLVIPLKLRQERKTIGMFRKGQKPDNKGKKQSEFMSADAIERTKATRFKKGNVPHNTKEEDGEIVIRTSKGKSYHWIRVSLGRWYPLHQLIWQQANRKVPKGSCLWFSDGNSLNCTLDNLEVITRAENRLRNKTKFNSLPPELKEVIKLTKKLNKVIKSKSQL